MTEQRNTETVTTKTARYALQYRAVEASPWETLDRFYFAATAWDRRKKEVIIAADPDSLFKSRYGRGRGEYRITNMATGNPLAATVQA